MAGERKSRQPQQKQTTRKLILRALTDVGFRRHLAADPKAALGVSRITEAMQREIRYILATVKGIEHQISSLADELLCAGGGCGIA